MSFRDDLDYLKANYPILSLVRELQLDRGYINGVVPEKSDRDHKTRCPIHDDADPSAKVYLQTNSAFCWVCQRAWDPPGLYHAYHGTGLRTAVRTLLRRLGRAPTADPTERSALDELLKMIADLEAEATPVGSEPLRAWLVQVRLWAGDMVAKYGFLALEEVEDATIWAAALPARECARAVRHALAWAAKVHPELGQYPGPLVEDPTAAYIAGVPSSSTGED